MTNKYCGRGECSGIAKSSRFQSSLSRILSNEMIKMSSNCEMLLKVVESRNWLSLKITSWKMIIFFLIKFHKR